MSGLPLNLLLLGGSGATMGLVQGLGAMGGVSFIVSLSGGGRLVLPETVPQIPGGFGGETGFRGMLGQHRIGAVLDATHAFASRISQRSARVCKALGIPYCQVLRPEWAPQPGDQWITVASESEAAEHVPLGARVFSATGRDSLPALGNMAGRRLFVRRIGPVEHPFPYAFGEFVPGIPPFSVEEEAELFRDLEIDWLMLRNTGSQKGDSKLTAARELGLNVLMIARPEQPEAKSVETETEALAWVRSLI